MFRKVLLPLLSVGMMVFASLYVAHGQQTLKPKRTTPPMPPALSPFDDTVAGSGIVEAQTENISVGSALPGIVTEVFVKVGQKVKAQEPLFRLDSRQLEAESKYRRANLASAEAQLYRLERMPRPEELPASEARVREARATLVDQQDQLNRGRVLFKQHAIADEDMVHRQQAYRVAQYQLERAEADFNLLKAGSWEADKLVARAAVELARSQLEQTQTDLDRLTVRALVDGQVLQVNVRAGEFVGAQPGQALIWLGGMSTLHVRIDIDEHDIPRYFPGAPAHGALRGDTAHTFPLRFVRVEPYVVPKKSLTGDNTERVDTRVLQVIYAIEPDKCRSLYVGQQLDAFVDVGDQVSKK